MIRSFGHPLGSYYSATAISRPVHPPLAGEVQADICIVGAGYTGLGAALELAQRGFRVIVVEAEDIGSGASGRNGGQIHSGQRQDQDFLEEAFGFEMASELWRMAETAKAHLKHLITDHQIACDLKPGLLRADHKRRFLPKSRAYAEKLRTRYGYLHIRFVEGEELAAMIGARGYYGGLLDTDGGHLHPLNLALGLAAVARSKGVVFYESTRALSYEQAGGKAIVKTTGGAVAADWLILAGDAYLSGLDSYAESRVMPINNFLLATEPFCEGEAKALIRDDVAVADSRFVVNYFRLSADRRLIFGGGETYRLKPPADLKSFARRHMLKIFPHLHAKRIDYAWGGKVGITTTRLPLVRRLAPNVLIAAGYSGQGVALAPYFGKMLGEAVAGTLEDFDRLARLPVPSFPGGRLLRWPTLVAAMSYFALRDRL